MINVLSKILGRKKSSNGEQANGTALSCTKIKESQSIWQKATSLRQSLRHTSRSKVGQKSCLLQPDQSYAPSSTAEHKGPKPSQSRREWGSQRNLARERRSLAATSKQASNEAHNEPDCGQLNRRSLHARSLCVSSDWDIEVMMKSTPEGIDRNIDHSMVKDQVELPRHQRSPRKLTKDSGYETSAQGDPDYINSISDWLSEEKALDKMGQKSWNIQEKKPQCFQEAGARPLATGDNRLEWNSRHRPLSFSHQEVVSDRKNRQLRHSYSQREVSTNHDSSRHQASGESLPRYASTELKPESRYSSGESVTALTIPSCTLAKSAPNLPPHNSQRLSTSSVGSLHPSDTEGTGVDNMVTRRFKKGSVYDALASTSGLDFSPVVQLKTYNPRREDRSSESPVSKSTNKMWEGATEKQPSKDFQKDDVVANAINEKPVPSSLDFPLKPPVPHNDTKPSLSPRESKRLPPLPPGSSDISAERRPRCIATHEKYPSWPVTNVSPAAAASYRSHSWTGHTDYPKEKTTYSRPKKSFKITTNHLQPVLEKSPDYVPNKNSPEPLPSTSSEIQRTSNNDGFLLKSTYGNTNGCASKPFDFEAFHTPCIPQCYEDKDYKIHSPPERDTASAASSSKHIDEPSGSESNSFLSKYEDVLRHQAQYSMPLSVWNKQGTSEGKGSVGSSDTPFLDRLRLDSGRNWPQSPPPPQPPLLVAPPGSDVELSSEAGTWMGSMESSSHGRGVPKWQGSYSDLSTLSTQLSNRSSLFDSGHSTMPESGRLSPQSSCDSTAPSLHLEGPTRAQVVARHGYHREIVAHSARVQQPERHGSESVLYYATGAMARPKTAMSSNVEERALIKSPEPVAGPSGIRQNSLPEEVMFSHRSQATLTITPVQSKYSAAAEPDHIPEDRHSPKRNSRKSSNSFSSDDSNFRARDMGGEDTSGSSSDVSNITCISNYRESSAKSQSWDVVASKYQNTDDPSSKNRNTNELRQKPWTMDESSKFQNIDTSSMKYRSLDETSPTYRNMKTSKYFSDDPPSKRQISNDSSSKHRSSDNAPKYRNPEESMKSRSMDEASRKLLYADVDKRQRISEPDLKAIQKQAVFSFYQRMSLAESIKSSSGCDVPSIRSPTDHEPPPPYEASSPTRLKMSIPKLSLLPNKYSQQVFEDTKEGKPVEQASQHPANRAFVPLTKTDPQNGLLNSYSKSVPNLVALKSHSLDVAPSHPFFNHQNPQQPYWNNSGHLPAKRGSPLAKDEIIPWDQLPSVLEKKREAAEKAAPVSENKDPPEDGSSNSSSATNYFKGHKSPRKVQLKEVHHSNDTASVKVITPDGVTLVQTAERPSEYKEERPKNCHAPPSSGVAGTTSSGAQQHHKRRPAPPPPPKQPPKRPPPPPPPITPPPTPPVVVILNGGEHQDDASDVDRELQELRIEESHIADSLGAISSSASSPQLLGGYGSGDEVGCCSSPELPLPPPPTHDTHGEVISDEPLPPPPLDVDLPARSLASSSLVYPKNSYMSYRSEKKLGRQGFDGNYHRSFHSSASSVDLTTLGSSFQDGKDMLSPSSWELMHNIRQHGTTVIFHSDCLHQNGASTRLQRSSSQDCVMNEEQGIVDNISIHPTSDERMSPNSIPLKCSENIIQVEPVPCLASQDSRTSLGVKNALNIDNISQHNGMSSPKMLLSESKILEEVIINCESASEDFSSLENGILTDDSFVDSLESDSSSLVSVDHNQNTVDNIKYDASDSNSLNSNDLVIRTNSSTQTTDTPRLKRKYAKTKEELECERLSMDFIHRYGDVTLKNLLVPAPNHRTMSDYMDGLLNLELEKGGHLVRRCHSVGGSPKRQNGHWEENWKTSGKSSCSLDSKLKQMNRYIEVIDSHNLNGELDLSKRRDELMISIGKKVETLRGEQMLVREEILRNEMLGQDITSRVQKLAKPNETEKYVLHVEEMEKIINLLMSLSGRLAKAENVLGSLPKDSSPEEKRALEAKREKLLEQHEDARRLKESIDRRSNQVSTFLHRYLTDDEYADYDHFIKMKTKLIVDIREIDERINLGEEQLAALRNSVDAHLWKSANS